VSVLVMRVEAAGELVNALPRVTLDGLSKVLEPWQACRVAYVASFPEAEFMTQLSDFRFVAIAPNAAHQVAGFGAVRSIDAEKVRRALGPAGP
jgi:hypothetical protein